MTDITLSLILAGIGIVTVFAVLLLFYASIAILMRVFRNKSGVHKHDDKVDAPAAK